MKCELFDIKLDPFLLLYFSKMSCVFSYLCENQATCTYKIWVKSKYPQYCITIHMESKDINHVPWFKQYT